MATPAVGEDIEALCGKCGTVWHVVMAKMGNKIAKVVCKRCHGQHLYRTEQPPEADVAANGGRRLVGPRRPACGGATVARARRCAAAPARASVRPQQAAPPLFGGAGVCRRRARAASHLRWRRRYRFSRSRARWRLPSPAGVGYWPPPRSRPRWSVRCSPSTSPSPTVRPTSCDVSERDSASSARARAGTDAGGAAQEPGARGACGPSLDLPRCLAPGATTAGRCSGSGHHRRRPAVGPGLLDGEHPHRRAHADHAGGGSAAGAGANALAGCVAPAVGCSRLAGDQRLSLGERRRRSLAGLAPGCVWRLRRGSLRWAGSEGILPRPAGRDR